MAREWRKNMLGYGPIEIIDGDRGKNYPKQEDLVLSGYCLFLNAGNITKTGFDFSNCVFISSAKDAALRKGKLSRHDIVLTTRGTVGNVGYYDDSIQHEHIRINSGMVIFRARTEELCPRYLYMFLRSSMFKIQVASLRTGSAQPQLPIRDINRIEMLLPPLKDQHAIACMLGALDDKIELNRKINRTLEATARALFKSWFVDFDPVHAKAEGRVPGLPKTIADLFPAEFEDSELGKIPRGWEVRKLRDCCERVENGGTPRRSEPRYWEPAIVPWLTSGEVRQDIVMKTNNMISKEGLANSSAKLWPAATTVVALYGATAGQVCFLGDSMCANQACCGLIPKKNMRYFVYLHLASSVASLEQQARGSAQQNLSQQIVADLPVMIPSSETLEKFDECLHPSFSKWIANIEASRTLASLRDMLLPKLLSGEISIANTERFIRRYI